MDLPPLIIQVAFVLVFLTMVWRYLDKRGQLELELLAIFGTTTAVVVSSLASAFVPAVSPVVSPLAVVVLLA
ncbi:MAG TPA: hypothetical protein VIV06_10535, partial [Candidatus Limnocylindrales bacterium]